MLDWKSITYVYLNMSKRRAFTLMELLIAIGVLGLIASLVAVSVNGSRTKARDTRRIADFQQLRKSLELAFNQNSAYPGTTVAGYALGVTTDVPPRLVLCGQGATVSFAASTASCDADKIYMLNVVHDPGAGAYTYRLPSSGSPVSGATYCIQTQLEKDTSGYSAATPIHADPTGVNQGGC